MYANLTPFYWHKNILRFKYDQNAFHKIVFSRSIFGAYYINFYSEYNKDVNFGFKVSALELPITNGFTERINWHAKQIAMNERCQLVDLDSLILPNVKVELLEFRRDSFILKYAIFPRTDSLGLFYFGAAIKMDKDSTYFFEKMDEIINTIYF